MRIPQVPSWANYYIVDSNCRIRVFYASKLSIARSFQSYWGGVIKHYEIYV
jgi:hypothetical protein